MKNFDLAYARHDPVLCLAPGLFRSLRKGERGSCKLDVRFDCGEDRVRFWGPEPLGADDLRVLQGLVAMAAVSGDSGRGLFLCENTPTEAGQLLRQGLQLQWDARAMDVMIARGSIRQLAKEIGYAADGGGVFKTIRASIERMWAVSVVVERNGKRYGFRILNFYASEASTGNLLVSLNPRLTESIIGDRKHTRINLCEVRSLRSDPARLLHQRLCGWIDGGKCGKISEQNLQRYVWPADVKPAALRQRRVAIKKALSELECINWKVEEYARGRWSIERPRLR